MRIQTPIFAAALLLAFAVFAQQAKDSIAGTWEGESACVIRDSPCHNEHVVYEISRDSTPEKSGASLGWKMQGYKIVDGKKQFMGTLLCSYHEAKRNLSCVASRDLDWEFFFEGENLHGTLHAGQDRILFRKVSAKRISTS